MLGELALPTVWNACLAECARLSGKSGDESSRSILELVGMRKICANKVAQSLRVVRRATGKTAEVKRKE